MSLMHKILNVIEVSSKFRRERIAFGYHFGGDLINYVEEMILLVVLMEADIFNRKVKTQEVSNVLMGSQKASALGETKLFEEVGNAYDEGYYDRTFI
ncbi:hypothetical protein KIN20_027823 [Parelaphostrongylus tenuis]|uniref:Uncharacterized protein n=1 Tax=Parelaphostrongylus tenuis TaxID=148309 RepID=A0AAD5WE84_PARTN|nr:hypothetical protein KIN20_027823 [Parelaphostrongylus tenuis]